MTRVALLATLLLLVPTGLFAATLETSKNPLVVSEPPVGNAYLFGPDLSVAAPVTGDLAASAGSVIISAPISGDALVAAGSIETRKPISGDLRAVGGRITVGDVVGGDLVVAGGSITVHAAPSFAWIAGGYVNADGGAKGPVTIYAGTVLLGGTFSHDVKVTASDRITIAPGTVIHGHLSYDAPQQIEIPPSAVIDGGVEYVGKSFLPTTNEAQTFALAGAGIFFIVRILAAMIAAGLFSGLFPRFAQSVADLALSRSIRRFALLALLGFGVLVATPFLIILLLATFAGAGVAFIILSAYVLLLLISYVLASIIAGAALVRSITKRSLFLWRDAVVGMLALSVVALVPVLGWFVFAILFAVGIGSLTLLFYRFAFKNEETV